MADGGGVSVPRLELAPGQVIADVVDLTRCPHSERFPDHSAQVAGLVVAPDGRLSYLRWAPGKARYENTWDATTQTLNYCVPERSDAFVRQALRQQPPGSSPPPTVNVLLLFGSQRYDVGTFEIVDYQQLRLHLVRRIGGDGRAITTTTTKTTTTPSCSSSIPPPPPLDGGAGAADSILEDRYRQLFAAWRLGANYRRTMYLLDDGGVTWYTPDGLLYDVLSDGAREWCGDANRHGSNCILEIKPVYPAQDVFGKLRALARLFDVPVLLVYGRPDVVATDEHMQYGHLHYHAGVMGILFRPGDGSTCRVHFNVVDDQPHPVVVVVRGEVGEFGPVHPFVVAGHHAVAAATSQ